MEFIPYDSFDETQQKIIAMKIDNIRLTHNEWRRKIFDELAIDLTSLSLIRFIKKTALGLPWKENSLGGRPPYTHISPLRGFAPRGSTAAPCV